MNDVSLNPEIVELEAEMEYEMPQYPVIPNPEGEPTEEITKMGIDDVNYEVTDAEARATLPTKVDKVEGKGLSTNDYTNKDKAIVDGVTSALDGKVDKVQGKGLSTNDFTDAEKTIVDGTPSALELKADKSDTYTKSEVNSALDNKVDKVEGKGLSENDFTDTLKSKLDGIEAEANKTVVDVMISPTSTNPVQNKVIYDLLNDLLPEATATGNPISISNASGLNAKSLKVELEPIQDLNGYDSPWVGGGGKNKCASFVNETTTQSYYNCFEAEFNIQPSTTYTISFKGVVGNKIYTNEQIFDYIVHTITSGVNSITVTTKSEIPANQYLTNKGWIVFKNSGDQATSQNFSEVQIELGSTATSYAPYSNICPISGRTQTVVSVNSEDTTIPFNQTVYGGEVGVTSGGTSDEWGYITLDGTQSIALENWRPTANSVGWIYYYDVTYNEFVDSSTNGNIKSNKLPTNTYTNLYNGEIGIAVYNSTNFGICIQYPDTSLTTRSAINTFLSNNPITVCYKKATPTTISTPSNEISLIKGSNTIVADGDMELVYSKTPQ